MGILSRVKGRLFGVQRSSTTADMPDHWLVTAMGGRSTASGESVSPESAVGLSAYFACIRNISEDLAKLPLPTYRKLERGREQLPRDRVAQMFNGSPNPEMNAIAFRETMTSWAMGWGDAYAEIEWTLRGDVQWLWPKHPSYCHLKRNDSGDLILVVTEPSKPRKVLRYQDVFHIHGIGGNGLTGYSVARIGCEAIGRALAVQTFGSAFFGNGAQFGNVFEYPGAMKPDARQALRESVADSHAGASNAFKTFVLENGGKISSQRMGVPPEEAQLLEVMQFTVEDLARWFRCPLSKIQYFLRAQGWSTLEMLNTDYVVDTLMPWSVRWEQEIQKKLLQTPVLYSRHNFNALLRGDSKTRSEFYTALFRIGVLNRNDICELEDRNPVPGGDVYYIEGSNLKPLGEDGMPSVEVEPQPSPAKPAEGDDPVGSALNVASVVMPDAVENQRFALEEAWTAATQRIVRKEQRAITASARKRTGGEWSAWLQSFYAGLQSEMIDTVAPIGRAILAIDRHSDPDSAMTDWCKRYCETRFEYFTPGVNGTNWQAAVEVPS
jgi:HK97 family phage portal protein